MPSPRFHQVHHALALPLMAVGLCLGACSGDDASSDHGKDAGATDAGEVAKLKVTGPITNGMGKPFSASTVALDEHGYVEQEYFLEGNSSAYALDGDMTLDGAWSAKETTEAPFKTRILVRRPTDAKKFNGSVVVEWLNVSGGVDGDPGFLYNWEEILREGYAYVGVSAQKVGIEGGGFSLVANGPPPLKMYDPERYGSLVHPGDAYSYDIYTQVAELLRHPGATDVLHGLEPKRLIAYGESQSAFRMTTYVNAVQPLMHAFDGFFIHSRGNGCASVSDNGTAIGFGGPTVLIREDIEQPVFQFETETDAIGTLAFSMARQPDTKLLRTWEVAGTSHADKHIAPAAGEPGDLGCGMINDGPQHFVLKAALHALDAWIRDGTAPAKAEPLSTEKDEHGNALGGVRTPHVDVPIATYSGMGKGSILCSLFGTTTPFSASELQKLYPTHADYVDEVKASARTTREAGFVLPPEEQTLVSEAEAADVPRN